MRGTAIRIFLYVNVISWLLLLAIRLLAWVGFAPVAEATWNLYLKGLLLNFFLLFLYFYYQARAEVLDKMRLVERFGRLFIVGLVTTIISFLTQVAINQLKPMYGIALQKEFIEALYHIEIGVGMLFLTQAYMLWKHMILQPKTERLVKRWILFEYLLLISLLFNFFEFSIKDTPFILAILSVLVLGFSLTFYMRWVVYLNSKEKWQSIFFLTFTVIFAYYFFYSVVQSSQSVFFSTDLMHSVYVLAMLVFVLFYGIFSILVILFNLPTSSVFEQKLEEITGFQRLVMILQNGEKEEQIYEALLDSTMRIVEADAAWVEVQDAQGKVSVSVYKNLTYEYLHQIREQLPRNSFQEARIVDEKEQAPSGEFASMLSVPLTYNENYIGALVLLKRQAETLGEEQKQIVVTFTRQASISVENLRLFKRALETERYKEEAKIARHIQQSLLPTHLRFIEGFKIGAVYSPASEVGGDYYDAYPISPTRLMLIISDVSGKGTNAAFYMAQMKGIFQTLAQLNCTLSEFLQYTNRSLSSCLPKNTFITASILIIDTDTHTIEIAQAGHCPILRYDAKRKHSYYLPAQGLGFGILRNNSFSQHLDIQSIVYQKGDIFALYTDGVIDARNPNQDEYGYERLQACVHEYAHENPTVLLQKMQEDWENFAQGTPQYDDYTALVLKVE
jgi:serine phosphatase RsbU (regulator of sigma subunit)